MLKQASIITDYRSSNPICKKKKKHFLCNHLAKSDSLPPFLTKRRVVDSQLPISHVGLSLSLSLSNGPFSLSHSLIFFYCFCLKLPTKNHFVSNILCFYLSLVLSLLFNLGKQPFFLSLFLCLTLFHYLYWKNPKNSFFVTTLQKNSTLPPF